MKGNVDSADFDGGFEEAKVEGLRLTRAILAGNREHVIDSLKNAKARPWFVAMVVAVLCDRLDLGQRGDLLKAMRDAGA